jgi:hypothetical protein
MCNYHPATTIESIGIACSNRRHLLTNEFSRHLELALGASLEPLAEERVVEGDALVQPLPGVRLASCTIQGGSSRLERNADNAALVNV